MLTHTLGCPRTFEFRREELRILRGAGSTDADADADSAGDDDVTDDDVTDDQVVESFLHEAIHPDGSLRQYLDCADVVAIVGNTLFAHGAVDARTAGFVPRDSTPFRNPDSKDPPARTCDDPSEWAREMNGYLRRGLDDFDSRPRWDAHRTTRGGEALLALQNRSAMWGRSVVSNCYGDGGCISTVHSGVRRDEALRRARETDDPSSFEGMCSDPADPSVARWLLGGGIRRVVVGHKPTGDCPAVLSASATGVEVVSGDTSFSDTEAEDNRGLALSVVEIVGENAWDNQLRVSGVLRDGTEHRSLFGRLHEGGVDDTAGDAGLGTQLPGGWWVKASTPPLYRLCRGMGRKVEYMSVHMMELDALRSPSTSLPN
uniref:Calcineurin-like phosphoesterase domain-containing protein n=1 Tax=Odontella aurita TaxID=265563 RepID=A0A7S4KAQ4_9STRA|mmetsp:Transcript_8242/g.24745  ORF Transcript_8242/g.24745 Transcript_8242/m.24745 type:complete len:373 (+) Transcript_8242:750-1868(+)